MSIPDYETLMLPVLRLFNDGAIKVSDCLPAIKQQFQISEEEASALIPSGTQTLLYNRLHWARTYLGKAGLLTSVKRNHHVITDLGRRVLSDNPVRIDNSYLKKFAGFSDWMLISGSTKDEETRQKVGGGFPDILSSERQTPEDAMERAATLLDKALKDELLTAVQQLTWQNFERLILELLRGMGYGAGEVERGLLTRASADGGIDGIIHEDALGLDAVYIQAKKYADDNKVGRPALQGFIGSLTGEGATKGVFVTTSDFSKEAVDYLKKVQHRVVLINGDRLCQLMIAHNIGVRVRKSYDLKSIDEDFFAD